MRKRNNRRVRSKEEKPMVEILFLLDNLPVCFDSCNCSLNLGSIKLHILVDTGPFLLNFITVSVYSIYTSDNMDLKRSLLI